MKITSKTTKLQLIAYAAATLGVELDESLGRDLLIDKVRESEKSLGLASQGDKDQDEHEETIEPAVDDKKSRPSFVMLRLHQPATNGTEEDAEPETHCIVGFNGRNFQIAYDVEEGVKVPYGVYDVIKNAVQKKYRRVKGKQQLAERLEQRYKFNVVKFID